MRLVGRDSELEVLRESFSESRSGCRRTVVVSGRPATGKSLLLNEFANSASESGAVVLAASAVWSERNVRQGLLEQVFRDYGTTADAVWGRHRDEAGHGAGNTERGADGMNSALLRRLWRILHDLTADLPVVICIDDVHFADAESQRSLLYLMRRLDSAPLFSVFSENRQLQQPPAPLLSEALGQPGTRRIQLRGLDVARVAQLVSHYRSCDEARRIASAVHQVSSGLPGLVGAVLADSDDAECRAVGRIRTGEAFGGAALGLLSRHGPSVMDLARAVAVVDDDISSAVLGRLAGLDPASTEQGLRALSEIGLICRGQFRHAAVREAVRNSLPPDVGAEWHRRAAELLRENGAPPAAVSRHIIAAGSVEEPWVVPVLGEAAVRALDEDDPHLALRYLRLARRQNGGGHKEASAILAGLARAEWRLDPAGLLPLLPELTAAAREGRLTFGDAHSLISYLLWHGRDDEASQLVARLCDYSASAVPPSMTRQLGCWFSYFHPGLLTGIPAPVYGDAADCDYSLAAAVNVQIRRTMAGPGGEVEDDASVGASACAVLERTRLADDSFMPLTSALAILMYMERLDGAADWCDALMEQAEAKNSATWQALFAATRAMICVRQGDLVMAAELADRAFDILPVPSWGVAVGLPLSAALLSAVARGDLAEAGRLLDIRVPDAMFSTPCGLHYIYARSWYYLAVGGTQSALHGFALCGRRMREWGLSFPNFEAWRLGAACAHLRLGDPAEAERYLQEELAAASSHHHRLRGHALRILAKARGGDPLLLAGAAEEMEEARDRFGLALVTADLSVCSRASGDEQRADALRFRADVLASQSGGAVWRSYSHASAAGEAGAGGAIQDNPVLDGLSAAQRRVATLAAAGHTNREISEKLHITVSTVEQHLTKVYRTLRVQRIGLRWVFEGEQGGRRSPRGGGDPEDAPHPPPFSHVD